jgi:hypothetical protein
MMSSVRAPAAMSWTLYYHLIDVVFDAFKLRKLRIRNQYSVVNDRRSDRLVSPLNLGEGSPSGHHRLPVELNGIEPSTSGLQSPRSPS